MITQSFDLNLIPRQAPVVVHCDQYDHGTGRLIIKLYNDSVAYTPSGTAVIQGKKPDGHGFIYNATMSGNTVTADLTEQMTAVDGDVRCQVVVTETTGRTGSFDFILRVQHSALPDDTEMSDSDYQLIEEALESVEDSEAWAVGERDGIPVGPDDITYHNNSKWWAEQSGGGGATSLSSLTDVNLSTLTDGEVLEYDGTTHKWENKGLTIPDDLNDLTDVSTSSPTNGQGLIYNTTSGKWENQNIPSGGASDLDDLTDVTLTTPTNGQVLQYDGSKWINANGGSGATDLDDLTDVTLTSPSNGQVLQYDGSKWVNANGGGGGSSTLSGLTDVSVASLVDGNYLRYNATSTKWENTWNDFSTDSLASLDAFVQGTANNAQSAHCFGTFFKVKDINNVFGLGANEWLRGYVVYQNITSNTYNNIGGAGILYKNASGDPYKFYIGGGGTGTYPWTVTVTAMSGGVAYLDDLADVALNSGLAGGQTLKYIYFSSSNKYWANGWDDYYNNSLSTLSDFVQGVLGDNRTMQLSAHNMSKFFKVYDTGNIFGFGANTWVHGFVSLLYNDIIPTLAPEDINGTGIVYKEDDSTPYSFYIAGDGKTYEGVPNPFTIDVQPVELNLKGKYAGLHGMTEITSSNADLNDYTTEGNYYKSDTTFGLSHYVNNYSDQRIFMTVKKIYDGGDVIIQDVIDRRGTNSPYHRYRIGSYTNGAWVWGSWSIYESTSGASSKATAAGGSFSSVVTCQTGDTTATFTDATYDSSWTYDVYCDDGTGTPIAISSIVVNASNQVVVTFASGLTATTSVKLHYWS